jgi:ABC-2 type transport system ATP-binding protein
MTDQTAIETRGLSRSFPGVVAVDGLTFDVNYGEVFGLVGPDGAGKTTTMRMLSGVLTPDSGEATVAGVDVVRQPEAAKRHLSYMSQRFGLYEDLTVEENIRFYADLFGVRAKERESRAPELLKAADMDRFRSRLAGKLSGGMKQKLGLVCALIHRPQVILLDEPTNGVDPVSRRDFWRILYSLLGEGVAILTSTAYLDEAERCHRIALMHQGRLLFCDTPARLKQAMPGAVIAVRSREPRRLRAAIEGAPGVASFVMVGDGVHAVVDDATRRIPEIEQRLAQQQIPFEAVAQVTPNIEDMFVSAVERQERSGHADE